MLILRFHKKLLFEIYKYTIYSVSTDHLMCFFRTEELKIFKTKQNDITNKKQVMQFCLIPKFEWSQLRISIHQRLSLCV